jgi:phosphoglycerate dehydrogenase-like enzyme
MKVWIPHEMGRALLGELPAGTEIEICADPAAPPSDPAGVEFWVPPFLSRSADLLPRFDRLEVIQLLTAGVDSWVGRVPESVALCDARGVHDLPVAEWVLGAAISVFRKFPIFAVRQERGEWKSEYADELTGKRVLIVGSGSIGRAVERALLPFEVTITHVARTARPGVHSVEELPRLLPEAEVVVVLVPMTEPTRGLVDAAFLAAMPDGALLINAARGPVVDTAALVTELAGGRLRAALDVTDPEPLPAGHPLWSLPNVLITPHIGGSVNGLWRRVYKLAGEQLRRHAAGEELINLVTEGY